MTTRRRFLASAVAYAAVAPTAATAKGLTLEDVMRDAEAARMGPVDHFMMGRKAAVELLQGQKLLPASSTPAVYVRKVLDTLMLGSNQPYSYRGPVFGVIDSHELNAYAAPGPFIFVTTGMLRFLQDEEELGAILGHELAHAELRHAVYEYQNALAGRTFARATDGGFNDLMQKMMPTIRQGYSVEIEAEADARAVDLVAAAGYRPSALINVLDRFKAQTNSYGGAKYPIQRTHLLQQKVGKLAEPAATAVEVRAKRFQKAMTGLPKSA